MKISNVSEEEILFDNGSRITFNHDQSCCETNYADFGQIEDYASFVEFDEKLVFEAVNNYGFRFGNEGKHLFFVPCYSEQNGYYTAEIDIYYKGERVLHFDCEERIY